MLSKSWMSEPFNGRRTKQTLIGYVETHETKEHTISYETASWYTLVDVPAGRYDVIYNHDSCSWVFVKYVGKITKEHFVNRLFTASSVHEPTENIGKERGCSAQLYDYVAAEAFLNNPDWHLVDDWEVVESSRYVSDYDGKERILYRLREKESA